MTADIAKFVVEQSKVDFECSPTQAYIGGILHDIGKLSISDELLDKRQSLTEREWEVMQNHPTWGYEYVSGTLFEQYGEVILHHHENPDGTGYPLGLNSRQY